MKCYIVSKWRKYSGSGVVIKVNKFTFCIPNSYYVLDENMRLVYPQHWLKHQKYHKTHGSKETTVDLVQPKISLTLSLSGMY